MRNAKGYGQIIFCDDGAAVAKDRHGRTIGAEADTFGCFHCAVVVFVNAGERPEDIGGLCKACMGLICPACTSDGRCTPFLKRLEQVERRMAFRAGLGSG